MHDYSQFLYW